VLWDIVRNLTQMVPAEDLFLICNDCIFKFVGKLMQKNVRAERGGGKVAKSKVKGYDHHRRLRGMLKVGGPLKIHFAGVRHGVIMGLVDIFFFVIYIDVSLDMKGFCMKVNVV
jgi:hypothetical protein